ncbi:MAG: acyltransferase [Bacteroidota bacterium]
MRLEQLTFTRFVAAISIVVFHYGTTIFPFNLDTTNFLFQQANIGVSYFFILSGFVMIIAYGDKTRIISIEYLIKRLARLYPVYLLGIIIYLTYIIIAQRPIDYTGLLFNLTMIQSWIHGYALSFNGPGWSLSVELFFYISFPFLFNHFYKKYSFKTLVIPIILIFAVSQIIFHFLIYLSFESEYKKIQDTILYFPLLHFNEFLIGNLAGLFFIKGIKNRNYDWSIIILIVLLGILLKFDIGVNYHNGLLAIIFVPLILLISSNNGILTKIYRHKYLIFLGEISYGIYILQNPIHKWVHEIMKYLRIDNTTITFYTFLAVLILFSALSYKYIESPSRVMINKMCKTRIHV